MRGIPARMKIHTGVLSDFVKTLTKESPTNTERLR
jgi:hypothetical protein